MFGAHDELLDRACQAAGFDDFGGDAFREGYARLLVSLDAEAGLHGSGIAAAQGNLLGYLVARLRSVAGIKAHPQAMARPIVRPLIITGIVRSGTTALHKLLAMDPQFQCAEHWLTYFPQPRPPRQEWPGNPDFRTAKRNLDSLIEIAPEMLADHGMAADQPEETLFLLAQSFHTNLFPSTYHVPEYDAWYQSTSDRFSYEHAANNLRLIGAHDPERTWLLKNPTDAFSLRDVLDVFPDAMIVQTHRDPVQAVPSLVNLLSGGHRIFLGEGADMKRVIERENLFWAEAMRRAEAAKDSIPGQYVDIFFNEFVADQLGAVRRIYDHFNLTLDPSTEAAMRDWLARNPRRSTTMQRFTPEYFGLPTQVMLDTYQDYRRRYDFA